MTAKIMKEIEAIKITLATAMAEKLGWLTAVKAQAAVIVFLLSIMTGGFGFLYFEMKEVKDDLAVLQRAVNQLLFIAKQNADPETLGALNNLFNDTSIDTPDDATNDVSDATSATPNPTSSDAGDTPAKINVDTGGEACYITPNSPLILIPTPTKEKYNVPL